MQEYHGTTKNTHTDPQRIENVLRIEDDQKTHSKHFPVNNLSEGPWGTKQDIQNLSIRESIFLSILHRCFLFHFLFPLVRSGVS